MKNIIMISCLLTLSCMSMHAANDRGGEFFNKQHLRLKAEIETLELQLNSVTNDLHLYTKIFNSIEVPDAILVTNVISKNYCETKFRKLSPYEKKIRRVLLSLDNKDLEAIYCKYCPDENFKRLRSDFKDEYLDIVNKQNEFNKTKRHRRKKNNDEIAKARSYESNLKRSLKISERDYYDAEKQLKLDKSSIAFNEPLRKKLAKKYHCEFGPNILSAIDNKIAEIKNQLNLSKQIDIAINEARSESDAESVERFEQDKNNCIARHYDRISSEFITYLSHKADELKSAMLTAVEKERQYHLLCSTWDCLDDSIKTGIVHEIDRKTVNAVLGDGFYDRVKKAEDVKARYEAEKARYEAERARDEAEKAMAEAKQKEYVKEQAEIRKLEAEERVKIRKLEVEERDKQRQHELKIETIKANPTITRINMFNNAAK